MELQSTSCACTLSSTYWASQLAGNARLNFVNVSSVIIHCLLCTINSCYTGRTSGFKISNQQITSHYTGQYPRVFPPLSLYKFTMTKYSHLGGKYHPPAYGVGYISTSIRVLVVPRMYGSHRYLTNWSLILTSPVYVTLRTLEPSAAQTTSSWTPYLIIS